ncbi:tryptophan synthase subunit alpha [Streptomyces hygroscopicus]|uniref:tryptophan synthase subunit alpha n=1 Tax=Streptomyces hygroscopicus TaxID=1912 RepID=UPI001FCA5BA1|nr:tryptophan synthase subunit alpha [Streptomyces hygroscopicus]BDH10500.1 tryptophan synthase alpha chain [Streptomyces hygroscopicus]
MILPATTSWPHARPLNQTLAAARSQGRAALATYLPVGYPSVATGLDALYSLAQHADILELGVPHSHQVRDGPVIQHAAKQALADGFRMQHLFAAVGELSVFTAAALLVKSYWHPIERFGVDQFVYGLADAGGCGVLIPDLPIEEAGPWLSTSRAAGLDTLNLVSPHFDLDRLAYVCAASRGMVYAPATWVVTGAHRQLSSHLPQFVARLRAVTMLPVGIEIGVSTAAHAAACSALADAVMVSSPVICRMEEAPGAAPAAAASAAHEFADVVRRPLRPAAA